MTTRCTVCLKRLVFDKQYVGGRGYLDFMACPTGKEGHTVRRVTAADYQDVPQEVAA